MVLSETESKTTKTADTVYPEYCGITSDSHTLRSAWVSCVMPRPTALAQVHSIASRLRADTASTGRDIVIAVIDSDFVGHPDLTTPANRILRYVDATTGTESTMPPASALPRHWHGTMTACTTAGNGQLSSGTYSSLAPEAAVILLRTMHENGRIPTPTIVRALDWLIDNADAYDIRVVNISVYADEFDQTLEHPVTKRVERLVAMGIVVVAAAGNDPTAPIRSPASAPSAITVGGLNDHNRTDHEDLELYHSSFGITSIGVQKPDVIAPAMWLAAPMIPGTDVQREAAALSALDAMDDDMLEVCAPLLLRHISVTDEHVDDRLTLRQAITTAIKTKQIIGPHYKMVDGTSFAAPIVTSIVAQMLAMDPTLTPVAVKDLLLATARPLADHPLHRQGSGMVIQSEVIDAVRQRIAAAAITV